MAKNKNEHINFVCKILIRVLLLALICTIFLMFRDLNGNVFNQKGTDGSMEKLYFLATIFVTGLIACIAYFQLNGINETASNDFMFRILKLYQSPEILKARQIIHKAHLAATTREGMPETEIRNLISIQLLEVKKDKKNKTSAEEFVCLNNLLELMEDLAYYSNNNLINRDTVAGLKAGSILYFNDIFKDLILDRRKHDSRYYAEFEALVRYIKAKDLHTNLKNYKNCELYN